MHGLDTPDAVSNSHALHSPTRHTRCSDGHGNWLHGVDVGGRDTPALSHTDSDVGVSSTMHNGAARVLRPTTPSSPTHGREHAPNGDDVAVSPEGSSHTQRIGGHALSLHVSERWGRGKPLQRLHDS
jgi:hypothetical protein